MQIESPGQVSTLIPEKPAAASSPGGGTHSPPSAQNASPQTERAVREPPTIADSPPRQSGHEGGVDILV